MGEVIALTETGALRSVFSVQLEQSALLMETAKCRYRFRALLADPDLCLTWEELTPGQRGRYIREAQRFLEGR